VLAAVAGSLLLNFYFVPPLHEFTIAERNNAFALAAFVAVALMVSAVVDLAARRTGQAARATAEAEVLAVAAGDVLRGERALPAILDRVRETFGMTSATLLERDGDPAQPLGRGSAAPDRNQSVARRAGWRVVATSGTPACARPEEGDTEVPIGDLALVLRGRMLPAEDRRVLAALAAQAAVALRQRRLADAAAEAGPLAEADRTRTALLAAVSHDLRTPLASAKASVTALRSPGVHWKEAERAELLATADESLDRLTRLVNNLLDMSRLQAGALGVHRGPIGVDDVMPAVLAELGPPSRSVRVRLPDDLPELYVDAALLERILANLLGNALRHSPADRPPLLSGSTFGDRVELRVVDRGPGVAEADWDRIFVPFQRLGDRDNTTGVGLGLALSRGLAEAMGGTLEPENTPGGGLTMVLSLPAVPTPASRPRPVREEVSES
jgi:two-component system sensor histidine kinase KdpD